MSLISACSSSTDGSACDAIEIWQAARRGTFATVPNQDDIVSDAISTSIVGAVSRCCVCGDAIDRGEEKQETSCVRFDLSFRRFIPWQEATLAMPSRYCPLVGVVSSNF